MNNNPSKFQDGWSAGLRPVESISFNDVQLFLKRLNNEYQEFIGFKGIWRLPTEAEWEYLARGGEEHLYAGSNDIDEVVYSHLDSPRRDCAYTDKISHIERTPFPVGLRKPNGFGLYDMSGNVWEMVWDRYGNYPTSAVTDPVGPPMCELSVPKARRL